MDIKYTQNPNWPILVFSAVLFIVSFFVIVFVNKNSVNRDVEINTKLDQILLDHNKIKQGFPANDMPE